jgi:hypothetical protein
MRGSFAALRMTAKNEQRQGQRQPQGQRLLQVSPLRQTMKLFGFGRDDRFLPAMAENFFQHPQRILPAMAENFSQRRQRWLELGLG